MSTSSPRWWLRKRTLAGLVGLGLFSLGCTLGSEYVAYDLPAEEDTYTLELEADGVHTAWEYTSARPTEDTAPADNPCVGELFGVPDGDCSPEPLIFLQYELGLDLDNQAPAGRQHEITVTAYYQDQVADLPTVTELRVEVTGDGGDTWQEATVVAERDGVFTASFPNPPAAGDPVPVGLRVTAADDGGNSVVQTAPEAYLVR